jgi:hypothetical protein
MLRPEIIGVEYIFFIVYINQIVTDLKIWIFTDLMDRDI